MRAWLAALGLCVLLVPAAGCSTTCTSEDYDPFWATLIVADRPLPLELVIRLGSEDHVKMVWLDEEDGTLEVVQNGEWSCHLVGSTSHELCGEQLQNCISCSWRGQGHGFFDATAPGYQPVHVELYSELAEDSDGCSYPTADGATVLMEPL